MKIICPGCNADYNVDDHRIPPEGMKATCPRCASSWVVKPPGAGEDPMGFPLDMPAGQSINSSMAGDGIEEMSEEIPAIQSSPPPRPAARPVATSPAAIPGTVADALEGGADDDEEEVELEPHEISILGRTIHVPNLSRLPWALLVSGVVGVAALILVVVKLGGFHESLKAQGVGFGQFDVGALTLSDVLDSYAPVKDEIAADGSYEQHLVEGLKSFDLDTVSGLSAAEQSFRKAAKLKKKDSIAESFVGETLARLALYANHDAERMKTADRRIERALRLDPDKGDPYRARAVWHRVAKNIPKARESVQTALSKNANDARALVAQGRIEFDAGSIQTARQAFQAAVGMNPSLAAAQWGLGEALERSAEYSSAETAFREAVKASPGHAGATISLARLKFERFNLIEDAVRILEEYEATQSSSASPAERAEMKLVMASAYHRLGSRDKALEVIAKGREIAPKFAGLVLLEAKLKGETDPTFNVPAYVDSILTSGNTDPLYLMFRAENLAAGKNYRDAIDTLERVTKDDPNNAAALYLLGRTNEMDGNPDKALAAYDQSLRADQGFGETVVRLAMLKVQKGSLDDAAKILEASRARNDRQAAVHDLLGVVATKRMAYEQAQASFQRALEIDPRYVPAIRHLAEMALQQKDFARADRYISEVRTLDPGSQESLFLFGYAFEAQGKYQQAAEAYVRILEADPKNVNAMLAAGRAYIEKENFEKGLEYVGKAVERVETDPVVYYELGRAYLGLDRLDEADRALQNSLRFSAKNADALFVLSKVSFQAGRVPDAIRQAQEALQIRRDFFEAQGLLVECYLKLNSRREALEALEKQIGLAKTPVAQSDLYVKMGEIRRQDSPEEALESFKKAYALNKKNARALYAIGSIEEENNNLARALQYYKASIAADAKLAVPHRHLGFIYASQNQRQLALREFQTYLRLDPDAKDRDEIRDQMSYLR